MKWTDEQQRAIDIRNCNVLVSAAAGSGKTAVLTERIRKLIMEDGISVENMLIVTFSNAAAVEMKEKIIKALNSAANEEMLELSAEKVNFLRRQISLAHTADISTFHHFAMNVIRKYFYKADVEPGFLICDEARRDILIAEVLDNLIEDRFENDSEKFKDFMRRRADVRSDSGIRTLILELYSFIMSLPEPFVWLDDAVSKLEIDVENFENSEIYITFMSNIKKDLNKALAIAENVVDECRGIDSIYQKAESDYKSVSRICEAVGFEELSQAFNNLKFATFTAKKDEKEDFAYIKNTIKAKRDKMKYILKNVKSEAAIIPARELAFRIAETHKDAYYLTELIRDFHSRFRAAKAEKNLLDFNDLEHIALHILMDDTIAEEYHKRFEVIFIDEYQDSSVIQETLIDRVSRGDNIFMVGDVKQSIYKFRQAEPEIFIDKYNSFCDDEGGIRIDLNKNFRSKGKVINSINAIFSHIMNRETSGIDYDDAAALKKGVAYEGELDKSTSLHLVDKAVSDDIKNESEELAELKGVELEAGYTAELVRERIGRRIYDVKSDCVREVKPGDIVILLRSTKNRGDIFANALKDIGISAFVDAGDSYFETNEIEVFINLLTVIDNQIKDIPLISVLRSPIFDFSIDELVDIRLAYKDVDYSTAFRLCAEQYMNEITETLVSEALSCKCASVRAKLSEWRFNSRFMTLEDFLQRLILDTGYMNYILSLPGGEARGANLRLLVDKAVSFASSQGGGLYGFLTYIQAVSRSKAKIPQAVTADDPENTVRIMTIHKSKGLEFPVVIVAGLGNRFNRRATVSGTVLHRKLGMGLTYVDRDKHIHATTTLQKLIKIQNDHDETAEEMRVYYVALTRAMDELVLVANVKNAQEYLDKIAENIGVSVEDASSFLDWTVPYCKEAGIDINICTREDMISEKRETEDIRQKLLFDMETGFPDYQDDNGFMSEVALRFEYKYPYTSDVEARSKFTVSELNRLILTGCIENSEYDESIAVKIPKFMKEDKKISAVDKGTAVHRVMQLIPFNEGISEGFVKEFVDGLVKKHILTESEADAVPKDKIAAFFKSDIGRKACTSKMIRREWPFTLKKQKADIVAMSQDEGNKTEMDKLLPSEVMIQGVIDCCCYDDGGIVIIDYKTDHIDIYNKEVSIERMKNLYSRQLALYRDVVENATGEKVTDTVLFLIDSGDTVSV